MAKKKKGDIYEAKIADTKFITSDTIAPLFLNLCPKSWNELRYMV